jgi:hypothetical protein
MDWLELRFFYIAGTFLFWSLYIYNRYRADHTILATWGFRKSYFRESFLIILPFTVAISAGIIWYGLTYNTASLSWHLIPVFLLYPAWGIIQQFLMIAMIAENLRSLVAVRMTDNQLIILISVLFSFAHFPDVPLMGFTFFMEVLFLVAYFKYRNLWSLGLFHGWIGSLLLYFVMGRDLWHELWAVF